MRKIIVAEDDVVTRRMLCKIVQKLGYAPVACSKGNVALEVLLDNPETMLIMTDMEMPGLSVRELIQMKMANENLKSIPLIIISGVVKLSEITDLLSAGATYFMPKPINITYLTEYIKKLAPVNNSLVNSTNTTTISQDIHSKIEF